MKILLIAPEANYLPVGMAYISASLKRSGHEVDSCYVGKHWDYLAGPDKRYDFIGTGGMSSQLLVMRQIRQIATDYGCRFLCGGAIITAEPLVMAEMIGIDYGVIGEGEDTIVELFASLSRGEGVEGVRGIVYRTENSYKLTADRLEQPDVKILPRPDLDSFGYAERLDMARPNDVYYLDLFDHPREYPLITSRTCPFTCTFCFQPPNRKYRVRDIDDVIDELREVVPKHRINVVSIYDELFHARNDRLLEFCRKFKAFRETLSWDVRWFCQARVTTMTDELLQEMADSGCFMISYGIESYSRPVLESMKKKISPEQIDKVVAATINHKISVQGNFLFGDPVETIETAQETLDFWRNHLAYGIVLYWIIPIPGSQIFQLAREKGLLGDLEDFLVNRYYKPVNVTGLSTRDFHEIGRRVFQHKMIYTDWQVPREATSSGFKVECPHCRAVNDYQNYPISPLRFQTMCYCRSCRRRFYVAGLLYRLYAKLIGRVVFAPWVYSLYVEVYDFLRKRIGRNARRKVLEFFVGRSNEVNIHAMREESRIGKNV